MKKRPESKTGVIDLPLKNFRTLLDMIETEKDYEDVKFALY